MSSPIPNGPAPGTSFSGPLISGPRAGGGNNAVTNQGICVLEQSGVINQNGVGAVDLTFNVPKHSKIIDFIVDRTIAFDSATSASLTIGTVSAGTQYSSGIDCKAAAGRTVAPVAPTLAQMNALDDVGTTEAVVATVTTVGATTVGQVKICMRYAQTVNYTT